MELQIPVNTIMILLIDLALTRKLFSQGFLVEISYSVLRNFFQLPFNLIDHYGISIQLRYLTGTIKSDMIY